MVPQLHPRDLAAALQRLGFERQAPRRTQGDHLRLIKQLDHPEGKVNLRTQIDMGTNPVPTPVLAFIRRQVGLAGSKHWGALLRAGLEKNVYEAYLMGQKRETLLPTWFR